MSRSSDPRRQFRAALAVVVGVAAGVACCPARAQDAPVADKLVAAFDGVFKGPYARARAIHAKGILTAGVFRPDPDAASVSSAPHLTAREPVPVLVRFSAFSGIPTQADGRPGTNPTGMSIKFQLPNGVDTDIVAHSYDGFPAGTPQDFLEFLTVTASGDAALRTKFLGEHPAAARFVGAEKPTPVSYGTERYFGVNAFRFTNAAAVSRFGRYRIYPLAGPQYLPSEQAASIDHDYLNDELHRRLQNGLVGFRLAVQLAAPEDPITDGAAPWPASRPEQTLGTLELRTIVDEHEPVAQAIFFSPMNLVPGIAPSGDPMLAARTRAYAISYRRRVDAE